MQNEQVNVSGAAGSGNLETNVGDVWVGAIGWGFGNGLRVDGEFDYRYNGLNKLTGPGSSVSVGGSEQSSARWLYEGGRCAGR